MWVNMRLAFQTVGISLLLLLVTRTRCSHGAVTTPFIDIFEQIALDGSIGLNGTIYDPWGGHQPKLTRHSDGSVRLLYFRQHFDLTQPYRTSDGLIWTLMRKDPITGNWTVEASDYTVDDAHLLRDARDDRVYIVSYRNSLGTVYASPLYQPVTMPGPWQIMTSNSRHYGNAGIGPDGTVCLKNSREASLTPNTAAAMTEYVCGNYDATNDVWHWSPYVSHVIGQRYAYDYLFPNPRGLPPGLYGFSNRDAHKLADRVPNDALTYIFNGFRAYVTGIASEAEFRSYELLAPIPIANYSGTKQPYTRMTDIMLDSSGRVWTNYFVDTPAGANYIQVSDVYGHVYGYVSNPNVMPATGLGRTYEDVRGRMWWLWGLQGSQTSYFWIVPIYESGTRSNPIFTLGTKIDLSSTLTPYSLDGYWYMGSQRAGSDLGQSFPYVDIMFNFCNATYATTVPYLGTCYGWPTLGRVHYARIRLPD